MILNCGEEDLLFLDETKLYDGEGVPYTVKHELPEKFWEIANGHTFRIGLNENDMKKLMLLITQNSHKNIGKVFSDVIHNQMTYKPMVYRIEAGIYRGKYRTAFKFFPLPDRAERIRTFKEGKLFGDAIVTDLIAIEFFDRIKRKNEKPLWKMLLPIHIGSGTHTSIYDGRGPKMYEKINDIEPMSMMDMEYSVSIASAIATISDWNRSTFEAPDWDKVKKNEIVFGDGEIRWQERKEEP